ncbi:thioesterase family protein [Shewanella sp. NIFS-20-20]|uniref:acyl-CoA thioesterase n=1 Tax=Shewanella sp. NIFS-20-20 TaxID=2853806 RepID=UPI001C44A544|nr:thioesterase family protein [Shewanella sp. NIFS-20-20]MBV7317229.1 acyl-CoA thioesterase [Shewanella sp. NIFS-20-20]
MTAFSLELNPRFNETDALGHINNTVIPGWFEAGRTPVFAMFNPTLNLAQWNLIVAGYTIAFKAPTYYGTPVSITTEVSKIGNSSFELRQRCWQQGKLTAEAHTSLVHYNYQDERSEPIPSSVRALLTEHLIDDSHCTQS